MGHLGAKKRAFWESLAEAAGIPPPRSCPEYAELQLRWRYLGYAGSPIVRAVLGALQSRGYSAVNRDAGYCVCGQPIERAWVIVSHRDRKYAFIGSECRAKLFASLPTSKASALSQALAELKAQVAEGRKFGADVSEGLHLLGITTCYLEKATVYGARLKVSPRYAKMLTVYTGLEWKWRTWVGEERGGQP